MKILFTLILALTFVIPAFATIDPDPDQIGVYFDPDADITCIDVPTSTPFWAHVIITRPTSPVHGVAFSLCEVAEPGMEGVVFRLEPEWVDGWIDPRPVIMDLCGDGIARGFGTPLVPQPDNVLLASIQFMVLAPVSFDIYLEGVFPEELPAYQGAAGEWIQLGVSSGDPALPVASVNGCNAVAVEDRSWGDIKAIYR